MVDPADVPRILIDVARLVRQGEVVVFGSAALAFYLQDAPTTRDVDVWCQPAERGDRVQSLMGELSWYHDRHGSYVEVWAPETFRAPSGWRDRAQLHRLPDVPEVTLIVAHPHDVLFAKLERMNEQDVDHMRRILREFPLSLERFETLKEGAPYVAGEITDEQRVMRFRHGLERLQRELDRRADG